MVFECAICRQIMDAAVHKGLIRGSNDNGFTSDMDTKSENVHMLSHKLNSCNVQLI